LRTYDDLIRQGKVRYIGVSNHAAWKVAKALGVSERLGLPRYGTVQPLYNLVARHDYEREMMGLCVEEGLGVITYASLASGFLSGKYRQGHEMPKTPRAQAVTRFMNEKGFAILGELERVAESHNSSIAAVSLAWTMARPGITAPIASVTTIAQLD